MVMHERRHGDGTGASQAREDAARFSREFWTERELRQAKGREGDAMLDLLRMAAHDLQAPLKILKLNAEFLADDRTTPELRTKAKRIIKRISGRLDLLLNDILEMAEGGGTGYVLHRTRFDLADLLRQAVETYGLLAEEFGMAIDLDIGARTTLTVEGDKMRLAQVCMNILTETIWTAPHGSRLLVQAIDEDGMARLAAGCQPGRRTASLKALDEPGGTILGASPTRTGLGLHITRAVLEAHGGSLEVQRGPHGVCNTFTVRVPLAQP